MANQFNQLDNQLKFKLIFLYLMSNIIIYLFCSGPSQDSEFTKDIGSYKRDGYTEIVVSGKLLIPFQEERPISIYNTKRQQIISYALLLARVTQEESNQFSPEASKEKFIIYLPKVSISKVLNHNDLIFLPYGKLDLSEKHKRMNHEIIL